jgi:hypothetical protein
MPCVGNGDDGRSVGGGEGYIACACGVSYGGDIKKIATRLNVNLLIGSKRKQVVLEGGDPAEYLSANANQLFKGVFCPAANLLCRAAYEANLVALVPAALVVVVCAVPVDPRPKEKFLQGHLLSHSLVPAAGMDVAQIATLTFGLQDSPQFVQTPLVSSAWETGSWQ